MLIARQPIFDKEKNVFAYELLYREVGSDRFNGVDGSVASSSIIASSLFSLDFNEIVGEKKVFIHFTDTLLSGNVATLLPKEKLVIEMINIGSEMTDEFYNSCKKLSDKGYELVFDMGIFSPVFNRIMPFVNIVKIDTKIFPEDFIRMIIDNHKSHIDFVAVKLENKNEYKEALKMGFKYFQGYYFSKPDIVSSNNLQPGKLSYMRMIKTLQSEELNFDEITAIIETDVAYTYEILKLVNSSYFTRGNKVNSVKEAVVKLGEKELRKWGMISALRKAADITEGEVLNFSLVRGRFMESFSKAVGKELESSEFLTTGILSMADVLMNTTMEKVITGIKIADKIGDALLGKDCTSDIYIGLMIILACEKGEWKEVERLIEKYNITLFAIAIMHNEAIKWTLDFQKQVSEIE